MLTHAAIANELGYPTLPRIFKYNDSFAKKDDPVIEYLVDTIEPALQAYRDHKYGDLFQILGSKRPTLRAPKDKLRWAKFFDSLVASSARGSVGDIIDLLLSQKLFSVPTRIMRRERDLQKAASTLGVDEKPSEPRRLKEYQALREVPYAEIQALRAYLEDSTVFSTDHSVKGAEFDDVIVVLGRGWTSYDFAKMVAAHAAQGKSELKAASTFQRSRNLFYVSASRAKHNLALLFVQELDDDALGVLGDWVGPENVVSIEFDESGKPQSVKESC
jgi:DNA helicase-2/ATP-dependent DNA helicase PcrA